MSLAEQALQVAQIGPPELHVLKDVHTFYTIKRRCYIWLIVEDKLISLMLFFIF